MPCRVYTCRACKRATVRGLSAIPATVRRLSAARPCRKRTPPPRRQFRRPCAASRHHRTRRPFAPDSPRRLSAVRKSPPSNAAKLYISFCGTSAIVRRVRPVSERRNAAQVAGSVRQSIRRPCAGFRRARIPASRPPVATIERGQPIRRPWRTSERRNRWPRPASDDSGDRVPPVSLSARIPQPFDRGNLSGKPSGLSIRQPSAPCQRFRRARIRHHRRKRGVNARHCVRRPSHVRAHLKCAVRSASRFRPFATRARIPANVSERRAASLSGDRSTVQRPLPKTGIFAPLFSTVKHETPNLQGRNRPAVAVCGIFTRRNTPAPDSPRRLSAVRKSPPLASRGDRVPPEASASSGQCQRATVRPCAACQSIRQAVANI